MDFSQPFRSSESSGIDAGPDAYGLNVQRENGIQPPIEYLNYLDIKLECIQDLPPDWYDPADAPGYHQHLFRYEVSIATPLGAPIPEEEPAEKEPNSRVHPPHRSKSSRPSSRWLATPPPQPTAEESVAQATPVSWMSFTHGRLLQPVPQYKRYIDNAVPLAVPGMDEVSRIRDVPETMDVLGVAGQSDSGRDRPGSSTILMNNFHGSGNTGSNLLLPDNSTPPVLLWVTTPSTDVVSMPIEDSVQKGKGKRRLTQNFEVFPLPPVPEKNDPPPCVFRIPLDVEQEAYLESLLSTGKPLVLQFKRVLKPGIPTEWEDLNARYYEASIPINILAFAEPGSLKLSSVVPLQPQLDRGSNNTDIGGKKKLRRSKLGQPPTLIEEPDHTALHPYLAYRTSAVISLRLQRTLARLASDRVRPNVTPSQLIPQRDKLGNFFNPPDVTRDFTVALEEIARKILRDYKDLRMDSTLRANATDEEREMWRSRFLEFVQSTGQLDAYKGELMPHAIRIAHDKFLRGVTSSPEIISELSNELYVYLMDCMHATLFRIVEEADDSGSSDPIGATRHQQHEKKGKLSEAEKRQAAGAISVWKSRALEAEMSKNYSLASKYYQAWLMSYQVPLPQYDLLWTDAAEFYIRAGDPAKAEQSYREAISCSALSLPALLGYGMWLMSYQRLNEAAVFLHGVVDLSPEYSLAWGCIALLDDLFLLNLKPGTHHYHTELAKWQKEQRYALLKALEFAGEELPDEGVEIPSGDGALSAKGADNGIPSLPASSAGGEVMHETKSEKRGGNNDVVNDRSSYASQDDKETACSVESFSASYFALEESGDHIYLEVANYCIHLHHRELANLCLARCRPGRLQVQRLYAKLFVQCEQYNDALTILESLPSHNSSNYDLLSLEEALLVDELLVLRAECEAGKGNTEEAIQIYREALCKGLTSLPPYIPFLDEIEVASPKSSERELNETRCTETAPRNRRFFFARAYLELGNLLLSEGKVRDALGVFTLGIQCWNCGLMWLGAGIAYFRMGEYEPAEECLNESNIRNPLNPRTWAYLTLLCLRTRRVEVEELVQRVMTQGLTDPALWAEIGQELQTAGLAQLSEVCLRKAIFLEEEDHPPLRGKGVSPLVCLSKYHLAHALASMHRMDEARANMLAVMNSTNNEVLRGKAVDDFNLFQR